MHEYPSFLYNLAQTYEFVEGVGDSMSDIPTRGYGVTQAAYDALGDPTLSDEHAALNISFNNYKRLLIDVPGYKNAPVSIKKMVSDLVYNVGFGNLNTYDGLKNAMVNQDWIGAIYETLDTANKDGMSSIGHAKRRGYMAGDALQNIPSHLYGEEIGRAEANKAFEMIDGASYEQRQKLIADGVIKTNPVHSVTQDERGKIGYWDIDNNEIFSYTPKNGRHPASTSNRLRVTYGE